MRPAARSWKNPEHLNQTGGRIGIEVSMGGKTAAEPYPLVIGLSMGACGPGIGPAGRYTRFVCINPVGVAGLIWAVSRPATIYPKR